jgi:hypothetical protein
MKKLDGGIGLWLSMIAIFWIVSIEAVTLSAYTPGVNPVGLMWNLTMRP